MPTPVSDQLDRCAALASEAASARRLRRRAELWNLCATLWHEASPRLPVRDDLVADVQGRVEDLCEPDAIDAGSQLRELAERLAVLARATRWAESVPPRLSPEDRAALRRAFDHADLLNAFDGGTTLDAHRGEGLAVKTVQALMNEVESVLLRTR
jgi:hypothetical protein